VGEFGGVLLDPWEQARDFGIEVAVTTRHGGVSGSPYDTLNLGLHVGDDPRHVIENRRRAARAFGVTLEDTVFCRQIHGVQAAIVGPADRGRGALGEDDAIEETDILVTTSPEVTAVILVADCVPLALVDPDAKVLSVVHAGWRGTAARVVTHALSAMTAQGASPERTVAFLGPAVAPHRYQVRAEVRDGLADAVAPVPLEPGVTSADGSEHWHIDLIAANRQQLQLAGIAADRIFASSQTTADSGYFSDRAARPCGRFGIMARLRV
jgi:polyphenol oxidase